MLYYIINILFNVSVNYNIYNIIYFLGEVKRNYIMVNYLKRFLDFARNDKKEENTLKQELKTKRANTQVRPYIWLKKNKLKE